MGLSLHTIKPNEGAKKKRKRVGRGDGSNKGTYSGRGIKGQRARAGASGFKLRGLRDILFSMPKKGGFKSGKPKKAVVNVGVLGDVFSGGSKITPEALLSEGLVKDISGGVKILGDGELNMKITVENCAVSKSAKEKIESAGGKVVV